MPDGGRVFEERLSAHLDALYRTALRLFRDDGRAAQLVERTALQAATSLRSELDDSEFKGQLFRLLLIQSGYSPPAGVIAPEVSFAELLELGRLSDDDLSQAIDSLEVPFRLSIWLHDVEGFEIKEVSRILGIPLRDAKTGLYGARIEVRRLLSRARRRA